MEQCCQQTRERAPPSVEILNLRASEQANVWNSHVSRVKAWEGIDSAGMAVLLGKRYRCENCGTQALCTKPGDGELTCCGKPMQLQQPRPLPSAD
jgi:desulfoferrodoxin-like iron-binding protein